MLSLTRPTVISLALCSVLSQPASASCIFFSEPQRYNTQRDGETIVIGDLSDRPYRVVVFSDDETTVQRIQACILDAFLTQSDFGPYMQAGSFERRSDAESLKRILQREGYDARVTYRR